jgi:Ubiquitin family
MAKRAANSSIFRVQELIAEKEGIPIKEQRFLLDGEQLKESLTLIDYDIRNKCQLDVRPEQSGMISTFTSKDVLDPLINFLMMTDTEREDADVPLYDLQKKAKEEEVNPFLTSTDLINC